MLPPGKMKAAKAARLTIELAERIIAESEDNQVDAMALGASILGFVLQKFGVRISEEILAKYVNNYMPVVSRS